MKQVDSFSYTAHCVITLGDEKIHLQIGVPNGIHDAETLASMAAKEFIDEHLSAEDDAVYEFGIAFPDLEGFPEGVRIRISPNHKTTRA